ncbi:MAG: hypothetical protein CVU88_05690 [Firmicutes bacterium HGW-Firmicutes-13]|nr:MAG: hypothetical protein CVU88_05690 [Firmicutes bacterium HGW-Firmicutes-13]
MLPPKINAALCPKNNNLIINYGYHLYTKNMPFMQGYNKNPASPPLTRQSGSEIFGGGPKQLNGKYSDQKNPQNASFSDQFYQNKF